MSGRRNLLTRSLSLSLNSAPPTPKQARPKLSGSSSMGGSKGAPQRGLLKPSKSSSGSSSSRGVIGGSARNLIGGSTRSLFGSSGRKRKIKHNVSFGDRFVLEVDMIDVEWQPDVWYTGDELADLARMEIKGCKREQKRVGKGNSIESDDVTWRGLEDARDKICRVEKAMQVTKKVLSVHKAQLRKKTAVSDSDPWALLREHYRELAKPDRLAAAKVGASDAAIVRELYPEIVEDPKPRKGGMTRTLSGMVKNLSNRHIASGLSPKRSASKTREPASAKEVPKIKPSRSSSSHDDAREPSPKKTEHKTRRTCSAPTTPKPSRKKLLAPTVDKTMKHSTARSTSTASASTSSSNSSTKKSKHRSKATKVAAEEVAAQ